MPGTDDIPMELPLAFDTHVLVKSLPAFTVGNGLTTTFIGLEPLDTQPLLVA